jgi:hypothetical protein
LPGAPAPANLGVPAIGRRDRARGPPMVVACGDPRRRGDVARCDSRLTSSGPAATGLPVPS